MTPSAAPLLDGESSVLTALRVLIVDDNEVNQRMLYGLIHRWGMRSGTYATGASALMALQRARQDDDPFHIALVDGNMPQMNGAAVARSIRSDPALDDTVLVLLTCAGGREDAEHDERAAGFAARLTKPIRPDGLKKAMTTAWSRRVPRTEPSPSLRALERPAAPAALGGGMPPKWFGARILVVAGDTTSQRSARLVLDKLGCRVDLAGDGRKAIELVRAIPYDLVFMDCQMPGMNGLDAAREIRRLEAIRGGRLPIVAMTADGAQIDREKCLEAGMDDCTSKPARRDAIQEALQRCLPDPAVDEAAVEKAIAARLRELDDEIGAEASNELLGEFLEHTEKKLALLRDAFAEGRSREAHMLLHDLKGSGATLGADELADACEAMERSTAAPEGPSGSTAELDRIGEAYCRYERFVRQRIAGAS